MPFCIAEHDNDMDYKIMLGTKEIQVRSTPMAHAAYAISGHFR